MEGVTFGNNTVKDGKIHQEVKWNALELRHNTLQKYRIRYGVRTRLSRIDPHKDSSESHTTLELNFNTSNITYYIQVAARSTQNNFTGIFSDLVSRTYTSTSIWRQFELKYMQNMLIRSVYRTYSCGYIYIACLTCIIHITSTETQPLVSPKT